MNLVLSFFRNVHWASILGILASIAIGFDLGLLTGLSVSPVVSGLITGILTLAGLVANWNSNKKSSHQSQASTALTTQTIANRKWAAYLLFGALTLPAGLYVGVLHRTTSFEHPKRNLRTYYTEMGLSEQQVEEIIQHEADEFAGKFRSLPSLYSSMGFTSEQIALVMDNQAQTLAGRYRNLEKDCLDLGLSQSQAKLVIERMATVGNIQATRHSATKFDEIEGVGSKHPVLEKMVESTRTEVTPKVEAIPRRQSEDSGTVNAPDPRDVNVFRTDSVPLLAALLNECRDADSRAMNSTEGETERSRLDGAVRYCSLMAQECFHIANLQQPNGDVAAYYSETASYLLELSTRSAGVSWNEKIVELEPKHANIMILWEKIAPPQKAKDELQ